MDVGTCQHDFYLALEKLCKSPILLLIFSQMLKFHFEKTAGHGCPAADGNM